MTFITTGLLSTARATVSSNPANRLQRMLTEGQLRSYVVCSRRVLAADCLNVRAEGGAEMVAVVMSVFLSVVEETSKLSTIVERVKLGLLLARRSSSDLHVVDDNMTALLTSEAPHPTCNAPPPPSQPAPPAR